MARAPHRVENPVHPKKVARKTHRDVSGGELDRLQIPQLKLRPGHGKTTGAKTQVRKPAQSLSEINFALREKSIWRRLNLGTGLPVEAREGSRQVSTGHCA